ncbi:plasmid pRiA4b ORF-3 family protein [Cyanobium sp. ATX 6A2]|uniref:plasmid pRiA4b ORF-3 family protein n=1 Tax=Cyanobium sp. ATX 6A2 TaxID=2823700 RepID=UPI0020CE22B5|nr:plasmid pRiA4b ORF-3 family protein [Cyanobium sp. ATX 6A2]
MSLNGIEPPIWRRFWVEETITLGRLHEVLQIVMGWQDYHLHQFITGERFEDQVFFMPPWDDGFGDPEFMARQRDETRVKSGVPWSGVTREDQPRLRRG